MMKKFGDPWSMW